MMNLGFGEIIFILVALLLFIGPKKLPGLAKGLGKGMKEFNDALRGITSTDNTPAATPEVAKNDSENHDTNNDQQETVSENDHSVDDDHHHDIDHSDLHEPEVPHDHDDQVDLAAGEPPKPNDPNKKS